MSAVDFLNQTLLEFIKLLISGLLGGIIGGYISLRVYRFQKRIDAKHENLIKKRDTLIDVLELLPWIHRDIMTNWEDPIDKTKTSQEHIFNIINKTNRWKALFLDDQEMTNTLNKIHLLVGESKDSFFGRNKSFHEYPGEIIINLQESIKQKITELNNSIEK